MQYEVFGFFALFSLLLFFFAETTKKGALGFAGSVLLLVLAIWTYADPIQMRTGEISIISGYDNQTGTINGTSNMSGNFSEAAGLTNVTLLTAIFQQPGLSTSVQRTQTTSATYATISDTPIIPWQLVIPLLILLLAFYGIVFYGTGEKL